MNHNHRRIEGFTLLEIVIVVVIVGIVALIAIIQYSKTIETNRADQAVILVRQVAVANHMYSLEYSTGTPPSYPTCGNINSGRYTSGQITNACNASTETCLGNQNDTDACDLVACGFLPKRDWDSLPYNVYALNPADIPSSTSLCNANSFPSSFPGTGCYVACVARNSGSSGATPYNGWGYALYYSSDTIDTVGGAPSP